jgi:hypothetical protein
VSDTESLACRASLRYGWTAIALFLLVGRVLEFFHLVKAPFYVEIALRRELWTLAHAHGTLLGLINVGFAATGMRCLDSEAARARASWLLRAGAATVPAGFFLGGIANAEGDPSLFIVLVPAGALLMLAGAVITARGALGRRPGAAAAVAQGVDEDGKVTAGKRAKSRK